MYYLWQLLGEDTVKTLEIKKMVYLFCNKHGEQLRQILLEMGGGTPDANKLYEAWRELKETKLYYKPVERGRAITE